MNQPVDHSVDGLVRYRIDLAYDGTEFSGWAKQPGRRTVQGELLVAMARIFGPSDNDFGLRVAGRTDAGVHASHQVAHFDLSPDHFKRLGRSTNIRGRLNSLLTSEVRIFSAEPASADFDARFSATFRRYRYRIADAASVQNPLNARYALWHKQELDLLAMRGAALELIGLHDFASFCKPRVGATTIRELREISISRSKSGDREIAIELQADAFCHNMVRSVVGALVAVGSQRLSRAELANLLAQARRTSEFKVVAAKGLTLIEVGYPASRDFAKQADKTRAMRENTQE